MRISATWSAVIIATVSLLAGALLGRFLWQGSSPAPKHVFAASTPQAPASPSPPLFIRPVNRANLDECARLVVEATWWREAGCLSNSSDLHIAGVKITRKETLAHSVIPQERVYLLVAHVTASFWKDDRDVLMVLQPE